VTGALPAALGLVAAALAPQAAEPNAPAQAPGPPAAAVAAPTRADLDVAITRGLVFLASAQRLSGGFGGPENGCFNDFWSNPEVHRAWSVGSTGLVVMLLLEIDRTPELEAMLHNSIHFLVENADLKQPEDWDLDEIWGHIYGLQGLALQYASRAAHGPSGRDARRGR